MYIYIYIYIIYYSISVLCQPRSIKFERSTCYMYMLLCLVLYRVFFFRISAIVEELCLRLSDAEYLNADDKIKETLECWLGVARLCKFIDVSTHSMYM